jgi:hypothetical protein
MFRVAAHPMFRKALRKQKKKEYFDQNGQNRFTKYKINQYDAKGGEQLLFHWNECLS